MNANVIPLPPHRVVFGRVWHREDGSRRPRFVQMPRSFAFSLRSLSAIHCRCRCASLSQRHSKVAKIFVP